MVFVLVEPQHPGNVGATVRAMANMGLEHLVLVNPPAFDPERARWMAPGCGAMIDRIRIVATLDEALEGCHRAVATTARHRKGGQGLLVGRTLADRVLEGPDERTAILFGREDFGLDADAVSRCDALLRIPTAEHASLNLGQAVLLVAHAIFEGATARGWRAPSPIVGGRVKKTIRELKRNRPTDRKAELPEVDPAAREVVQLLERVGYTRGAAPEKVLETARLGLANAQLSIREIHAVRGMVRRIGWALEHPETDWTKKRST